MSKPVQSFLRKYDTKYPIENRDIELDDFVLTRRCHDDLVAACLVYGMGLVRRMMNYWTIDDANEEFSSDTNSTSRQKSNEELYVSHSFSSLVLSCSMTSLRE